MSTLEPRTGLERARGRRLDLMLAMQGLEKAVASAAPDQETWLADVRSTSSDVMAALRAHIDEVEGEDGLLAEIRFDAPRLTHMVEDLEREHQDLLAACDRRERRCTPTHPTSAGGGEGHCVCSASSPCTDRPAPTSSTRPTTSTSAGRAERRTRLRPGTRRARGAWDGCMPR